MAITNAELKELTSPTTLTPLSFQTSMEEDQAKPLAHPPSPATPFNGSIGSDEEESSRWKSSQYLRKRRCLLFCCGCCSAAVILLGVTILVLALTVFKIKDPSLTMNAIHVHGLDVGSGTDDSVSVNATLIADVSIKNPNVASFGFDSSVTEFYYEGKTVGVAHAPGGHVSSGRTVRMNVTVEVLADEVAGLPNVTGTVLFGGTVNVTSHTDLKGRVDVLGIYRRDLDVTLNCTMTLDLSLREQDLKNRVCLATVM
ncbi:late embryogenesis abundant protein At1g64065-like [Phoenix dactylifera]|uniref:Late embryogenesis abundant protein At1g64065-like n=1 Tax=Phoenix dactylifera TaxID=42345 RepID=A0A8B7CSX3_PHODC|nr:late embryogenesis abundant protein At1g64065-like [Phoenix dactylifera]